MQHPIGRHHRRCQSLTTRLWALFALTLAAALAHLFIPNTPVRAAIEPVPRRAELPRARPCSSVTPNISRRWESGYGDPDEIGGALVRPYMTTPVPKHATLPRPRPASGDLLAEPVASTPPDDLGDLANVIRTYLQVRG